jgi:NAD(P)-dependent dehydrogenase (short-subunit alcohol dehydrogenase family)
LCAALIFEFEPKVYKLTHVPYEKTMRVAVTGASGFVGSHIVKLLLQDGHTVHATVRNKDDATKTAHLNKVRDATK